MKKLLVVLALCLLSVGIAPAGWAKNKTYIAVGDSYAFGYTSDRLDDPHAILAPSFGAPGYVHAYARTLDPRSGNSRNALQVVNIAIPGETTASYEFGGSPGAPLNVYYHPFLHPTPYLSNFNKSQRTLLLERIEQAKAEKREIHRITIHLGGNDLQLLLGDFEFVLGTEQKRREKEAAAYAAVEPRYRALLTTLRAEAPKARLMLLGYANPFRAMDALPPIDPSNPDPNNARSLFPLPPGLSYEQLTDTAIRGMNALIADLADEFDATYVDIYTHFTGREGEWTYILDPTGSGGPILGVRLPNVHPTAAGYAEIANLLAAQERRVKD